MVDRIEFQAYVSDARGRVPIGPRAPSEAAAWAQVASVARESWPDEAWLRRHFEYWCEVVPVQVVEVA